MRLESFVRPITSAFVAAFAVFFFLIGSSLSGQDSKPETPAPTPVFRTTTRLVTVDVVAKDKHGHIVPNLNAQDFQVFEQIPPKRGDQEEKIANFLAVSPEAILAESKQQALRMPAGVYSNLVTTRLTVPPTILLLDGLNTEGDSGTQARHQMVKMLASVPPNTPVAVFILGHDLVLLQSFTRDPALLRDAAQKVMNTNLDNGGLGVDPHDDPMSLSNLTNDMFGGDDEAPPTNSPTDTTSTAAAGHASSPPGGALQMAEIRRFEKEMFASDTDMRVRETVEALRAIARNVSGYPGRKNLIWISTSFPMTIAPDAVAANNTSLSGTRNYRDLVALATNALADAKVSVYPVNPAGMQTSSFFMATKAPSSVTYGTQPNTEARTLNRESAARFSSEESMEEVAQQTGGKVCINNNDLGDCVRTAVEEGSTYYELGYYPDAANWHGEFHRIIVKSRHPGLELSFRQGYFARTSDSDTKENEKNKDKSGNDPQLQQTACQDLLTSTSVLVVAQALAPDKPGLAKYFLNIDARMMTFTPGDDGKRDVKMDVAICSFDRTGKPLQYFEEHVDKKFDEKDYASTRGISHAIEFAPHLDTARVRLVVRDVASGEIGSLNVPYAAPSPAAAVTNSPAAPVSGKN